MPHIAVPQSFELHRARPLRREKPVARLARQVEGLQVPLAAARAAYAAAGCPERLQVLLQAGVGHSVTSEMDAAVDAFFDKWLLGGAAPGAAAAPR